MMERIIIYSIIGEITIITAIWLTLKYLFMPPTKEAERKSTSE
jgi:hypothetical protein